MEDFYKIWLQHNPQARLTADEEKVLGRKIQTGKAISAKRKGTMLSTDEQKICSEGEKALNKLILCNIPLGIYFANKYAAKYPDIGLTMDDISQEALMGVMKAAERYDPDADCKFSTYAAFWIGQTIRRAIEDKSDAIRKPASAHSRARLVHKIESEANFTLSAAEIAEMAMAIFGTDPDIWRYQLGLEEVIAIIRRHSALKKQKSTVEVRKVEALRELAKYVDDIRKRAKEASA